MDVSATEIIPVKEYMDPLTEAFAAVLSSFASVLPQRVQINDDGDKGLGYLYCAICALKAALLLRLVNTEKMTVVAAEDFINAAFLEFSKREQPIGKGQ